MKKSEDLSEDITGYRSINHKIMFSDLPPDNSVYGSGSRFNISDSHFYYNSQSKPNENIDYYVEKMDGYSNFIKFKPNEYDKYIINQPIFYLNKQINLDDIQLIKQIALEAHIQRGIEEKHKYVNLECEFENYICPYDDKRIKSMIEHRLENALHAFTNCRRTNYTIYGQPFSLYNDKIVKQNDKYKIEYEKIKADKKNYYSFKDYFLEYHIKPITLLGIGPNIITRVKYFVNVFNSRLQHKEDEQYTEQSKQQQLIYNITSIITQQFQEKLDNQSMQFQEKMNIQSIQLKEVVERIQVLEQVVFRKTNDIKHDLVDIHHHITSIGEEILEKVDSNI